MGDVQQEVRDLRVLVVGMQRAIGRGRREDRDEDPDLSGPFIAQAAAAIMTAVGNTARAAEWRKRAVVSPAMTTVTGWAAELVRRPTVSFILSLATGARAFPLLMQRGHGFELTAADPRAISLSVAASAGFIGEGQPIPTTQATLWGMGLMPYSVKTMAVFSEEISDHSSPDIEQVLRLVLSDAIGTALENAFFSDAAQSALSPPGALLGATPVAPGATFADDVKGLVAALGAPVDPVFIVSPARRASIAASGALTSFDYPLLSSSSLDDDRMIGLDASQYTYGVGTTAFKVGKYAAIVENDAPPADLLTGSPVHSLWQEDKLALRATMPLSWTSPAKAAVVDGITW